MAEQEWFTSSDPARLLELARDTIPARKLRLFAVACCRGIYDILTDPRSRQVVDAIEQIADDRGLWELAGPSLAGAREAAYETFGPITGLRHDLEGLLVDDRGACVVVFFLLWWTELEAFDATRTLMRYTASRFAGGSGGLRQCGLLRCVVGNPFRPLPARTFPPHVLGLARSCYESFPAVGPDYLVLADALDELGEAAAASHCREQTHAKGCHMVDWVLGKS